MGLGGIGIWQLLIVLAIVVMLFGTKRVRTIGGDLGGFHGCGVVVEDVVGDALDVATADIGCSAIHDPHQMRRQRFVSQQIDPRGDAPR